MDIPPLTTARLTLRGPASEDAATYCAFYGDPEASTFYGGPLPPPLAWRKLAFDIGHWTLRGFGMWSVIEKATGTMVGGCGIVWPEGWPRPELTWWIMPCARRNGYAREASQAAIAYGYDVLGWERVETHMRDDNLPARHLVMRLGGDLLTRETFPDGIARDVFTLPRGSASL